ncbi:MAG: DNA-binding response regulator [Bacteroidetes bacterium]|nr:MAG: DNA-binding response regulator [Bacteroidota bacterium]
MKNSDYKILLVDDEPDILEFMGYNLRKEEYQVFTENNGLSAIEAAQKNLPHLIILDVMMPGMDGMETCHELKKIPELANSIVIFLTARSEDYSQMAGFDAGADDYVAKPIKPALLLSRVKALLRRYTANAEAEESSRIEVGSIIIDKERYVIIKSDQEIVLPKKEFELLTLLTSKPNKVFSREEIFSKVWGNNVVVGDRTIDVHVRKLREKIGIELIKTVKGVGYKFDAS